MIAPISGYGLTGTNLWHQPPISQPLGLDNLDLGKYSPYISQKVPKQTEPFGQTIQLHNIPEIYQWISKEIERKYKIKVKNSDIPFSEDELKMIFYVLGIVPESHLEGVDMIVKNKSMQLTLNDSPLTSHIFNKFYKQKSYGAYDKNSKTIYVFETDHPDQIIPVLKHEIGHAVHSYNMAFSDFFLFMLKAGWQVVYHEQQFIQGNELYNMGLKKIYIEAKEALQLIDRFSWESIRENRDVLKKYTLESSKDKKSLYAYKNPYETFATFYEKTH